MAQRVRDYADEHKLLAALAEEPIEEVLQRALDSLLPLIPYDLAVILDLRDRELVVRTATGRLASEQIRQHRLSLDRYPTLQRAIETRRPIALYEHQHASSEGDPYDAVLALPHGHSCMVVPVYAANRSLGVMTFDRAECVPYPQAAVDLAGVYGQLLGLALLYGEQASLLLRHRSVLLEHTRELHQETASGEAWAHLDGVRSPLMQRLVRKAQQVAETAAPVLILGETGTGKDVLARAIHGWSPRKNDPFVAVNCAAIPESLLESELFGHVRGAFTGATSNRAGRFLTANGGTLFLDELGDLPLSAQSKLLRILQDGTFEPVGSDRTVKVDVRVIAATNTDLEDAVRAGRFREDLYYRLDVFPLHLPPLRERREDVVPIAERVLSTLARQSRRGPWSLAPSTERALERHPWPGNVRQLVNALERATILQPAGELLAETVLPETGGAVRRGGVVLGPELVTLEEMERRYIREVLARTDGRIYGPGGAADLLGMKPTTLQSRMRKLGIARRARSAASPS